MAGLDPAIHVFVSAKEDVDARVKPGHDEELEYGIPVDSYRLLIRLRHLSSFKEFTR
jgi:hypothetical protein